MPTIDKMRTTSYVVEELQRMIACGELLPGQQIRQDNMAEQLGVSRLPVREALRQLTADGLVRHTPNAGYAVTRLSQFEFDQVYLMRRTLETSLLARLPRASGEQIDEVERLAQLVADALDSQDPTAMRDTGRAFHFAVFRLSDMALIINEIERLWTWASPYNAGYLTAADHRRAILDEHQGIVAALRDGDNERLVEVMNQHRKGSDSRVDIHLHRGVSPAV